MLLRFEETLIARHGPVRVYEHDGDLDRALWEIQRGILKPAAQQDNAIMGGFYQALANIIAGNAGPRDTLQIGYQAIGSGIGEPDVDADVSLKAETFRKARDFVVQSGNQILISTAFNSLEGNGGQGRIFTNHAGTGTPSVDTWEIAPYIPPDTSPYDAAFISAYFKRFRPGDLVRFGLGDNNTTYYFAVLDMVTYNADATTCEISVVNPLPVVPPLNATVDQCLNECAMIGDFPTPTIVEGDPAPTLLTFTVTAANYIYPGDYIRLNRPEFLLEEGASFDLNQYGIVETVVGNEVTVFGWALDYPVPGAAPPLEPQVPTAGDFIHGGRLYNMVTDLRYVKTRGKSIIIQNVLNGNC